VTRPASITPGRATSRGTVPYRSQLVAPGVSWVSGLDGLVQPTSSWSLKPWPSRGEVGLVLGPETGSLVQELHFRSQIRDAVEEPHHVVNGSAHAGIPLEDPSVVGDVHQDDVVLPRPVPTVAGPNVLATVRQRIAISILGKQDAQGLPVSRPQTQRAARNGSSPMR
jgi:hypothetical protein